MLADCDYLHLPVPVFEVPAEPVVHDANHDEVVRDVRVHDALLLVPGDVARVYRVDEYRVHSADDVAD